MLSRKIDTGPARAVSLLLVVCLALAGLAFTVGTLAADEVEGQRPEEALEIAAHKTADRSAATVGGNLNYTIVFSYTGAPAETVMSDTLPAGLALLSDTLQAEISQNVISDSFGIENGAIHWAGTLGEGGQVTVQFGAVVTAPLVGGDLVTNTAVISGGGSLQTPFAVTEILSQTPPVLTMTKMAGQDTIFPGNALDYTLVVSNGGEATAENVVVTDVLPAELDMVGGSLVASAGIATVVDDVITWNTPVTGETSVTLTFETRPISSLSGMGTFTNTAVLDFAGEMLTATAPVHYQTTAHVYFPIVAISLGTPTLQSVTQPASDDGFETYEMTVSWTAVDGKGISYQLQEAQTPDFTDAVTYDVGAATSHIVTHPSTASMERYYYRVRAITVVDRSEWSNVIAQHGVYNDEFDSSASDWSIRREDTDDVDNSSWYDDDGYFILKVSGRWDYAIASPVQAVPWSSYSIETRVRLRGGIDYLHSYGLIFGGDYLGGNCPNSDYTSCFNHYYRLNLIWTGSDDSMLLQLERVDRHDDNNVGRGESLVDYGNVRVGDPSGWNVWRVDVNANGSIVVSVNGNEVASAHDTEYVGDPYFGVFASTNEYSGAEPWFDWYRVTPLP